MVIKLLSTLMILMVLANNCFAQDSTYLNKGQASPFDGYLLTEQTVKNLRNDSLELSMYQRIDPLKDTEIKLLSDDNIRLSSTLESTSSLNSWQKIFYVSIGIVGTGLAISLAHQIYK